MLIDGDVYWNKLMEDLNSIERDLYMYLYFRRTYKTNIICTSYNEIMRKVNISNVTLKKVLVSLENKGYIEIIENKKNAMVSNYSYRVLVDLEYKGNVANSSNSIDDFTMNNIINEYTTNTELREVLLAYVKMRKHTKPISDDAELKILLNKLNKLASCDEDKITIIETSVINKWMNIFEPRTIKGKELSYDTNSEGNFKLNTTTPRRKDKK